MTTKATNRKSKPRAKARGTAPAKAPAKARLEARIDADLDQLITEAAEVFDQMMANLDTADDSPELEDLAALPRRITK